MMEYMQPWLEHPVFQAGIAPFLAALLLAMLLSKPRLSGLAVIAAFALTVQLVSGFAIDPLTSSRKLVMLTLGAAALAVPLSFSKPKWLTAALALSAATAAVWMAFSILKQKELQEMLLFGSGGALYLGWLVYWGDRLHDMPIRSASCGVGLGVGTGGAALIGSSALLGAYGLALAAAAAAVVSLHLIRNRPLPLHRNFILPLTVGAGLIGYLGSLTAQLPWHALACLALIPPLCGLPLADGKPRLQSVLFVTLSTACAAGAIYLTWRIAGTPPY